MFLCEQPEMQKCGPIEHKPERQDQTGFCFRNHKLFAVKAFKELEDA